MRKNSALLLNLLIITLLISSVKSIDCLDSEYIATDNDGKQTCELCNDLFVSSDKRNCQSNCLDEIKPIRNQKTCLAQDTNCKSSYSKFEKKCYDEGECQLLGEEVIGKSYYLCKDCPIDRYFQPINKSCVEKCEKFQYVDKDTKQCIDLEECELFQDYQNQACVDECVGRKNIVFKQWNKQFCGCLNNYLFNLRDDSCVPQCPRKTYKFNDICLMFKNQCDEVISADGEQCIFECPKGQVAAPRDGYKQCECEHFFQKSTQQCVTDCSTGTQVKFEKICLAHLDECPRYYDEIKNECQFWCDRNKTSIEVPNKYYGKCVFRNSLFLSINQIDYLLKCEVFQIIDIIGKKCLKYFYDCTGVISVDKQQCLPFCEPYQIDHQKKIGNHTFYQCTQCSGENKYFEEKDGVKKCVKECSHENALSQQFMACIPKEN